MKQLFTILVLVLLTANVFAQTPEKMSYQAVVRNSENNLVTNTEVGMQISILQGSEDGTAVYVETQTPMTNANGLVSIEIGSGTVENGDFSTIDWSNDTYFIKTETDPEGGSNYTITGVSQLLSVPYALHAKTAENVINLNLTGNEPAFDNWDKDATDDFDGDYNSLSNQPTIPTVPTNVSAFTNDAGYVTENTQLSETEVDAMVNNNGYLTSESDPDFNAWDKDYADLTNTPTIPTVPTNVSAFTNDAGYVTENTQLSETEVDAMVNNNGYLTSESDPDFNAWDKDYADLTNTPTIPTVPTNVSAFTNDAGYVTENTQLTETEVDAMVENNGYLTTEVDGSVTNEIQNLDEVLTQSNDAGNKNITNLADPVNAQDAVTKAYVDALLARIELLEESDVLNNGFTDERDDNHYNAVKIGNQVWMAENLKYLPEVSPSSDGSETEAYYYVYGYNGTDVSAVKATTNYQTYGVLYNWTAAMAGENSSNATPSGVQGVCPVGWHLPSDAEWKELEMALGMSQADAYATGWRGTDQGSQLAGNADLWADGALETNPAFGSSGFTALPGGFRYLDDSFDNVGGGGIWWSATQNNSSYAWCRYLNYSNSNVFRFSYDKSSGFSVRCVRD